LGALLALVVFPELEVVGGAAGAGSAFTLPEEPPAPEVILLAGLLVLVVFPEFAAAVGSLAVTEAELLPVPAPAELSAAESVASFFFLLFEVLLVAAAVLPSEAAGAAPVGGVALAAGSATELFFVALVATGSVFFVSPSDVSAPFFVVDLLDFALLSAVPDAVAEVSFPSAAPDSALFLLLVFLEVVEFSPAVSWAVVVESVESAVFFFFFVLVASVESLCD
jgi:hypothetical protein